MVALSCGLWLSFGSGGDGGGGAGGAGGAGAAGVFRGPLLLTTLPLILKKKTRKARAQNAPKAQKVASRVDETPTRSEGICPGVGPNTYFLPGR